MKACVGLSELSSLPKSQGYPDNRLSGSSGLHGTSRELYSPNTHLAWYSSPALVASSPTPSTVATLPHRPVSLLPLLLPFPAPQPPPPIPLPPWPPVPSCMAHLFSSTIPFPLRRGSSGRQDAAQIISGRVIVQLQFLHHAFHPLVRRNNHGAQ